MTISDLSDLVEQYKTDENACTLTCAIQALGEYLYLNLSRYRLALRDEDTPRLSCLALSRALGC